MTIQGEWADINVWRMTIDGEPDLVERIWDASDEDLDRLEEQYNDDPFVDIQVEFR